MTMGATLFRSQALAALLVCLALVPGCTAAKRPMALPEAPPDLPPPPPPPAPDPRWLAEQRAREEAAMRMAMESAAKAERSDERAAAYERQAEAFRLRVDPNRRPAAVRGRPVGSAPPRFARPSAASRAPGGASQAQIGTTAEPSPAEPATAVKGTSNVASVAAPAVAPAADKAAYCPAMEDLATPQECENYALLQANAAPGIAAFGAPRAMALAQYYPVKLVVGKAERAKEITAAAGTTGEVSTAKVGLGPWVCAQLQATDFDVKGDLRQCQRRAGSPQISFNWEVSPKREDTLRLSATVQTLTEKDGRPLDQIDSAVIAVAVTGDSISRFDKWMERLTGSAGGLRTFLLALASALGVLSVVIWRIRTLGQKPDKDALKDLTKG